MALFKLDVLEVINGNDAEGKPNVWVWVQENKPRKYKMKLLPKATASEINTITKNVGGTLLINVGIMESGGEPMMYFKPGADIDVLIPPSSASVAVDTNTVVDTTTGEILEFKTEPSATKTESKPAMPNMTGKPVVPEKSATA